MLSLINVVLADWPTLLISNKELKACIPCDGKKCLKNSKSYRLHFLIKIKLPQYTQNGI